MTEDDFKRKFQGDAPALRAWGGEIIRLISNRLSTLGLNTPERSIFQIVPVPRLKTIESAIDKAFVRKKYSDPYEQLTDKVGVRFVVLLSGDIPVVANEIETNDEWDWSKDRDYEDERAEHPEVFTYQSVHYIVRPRTSRMIDGVLVPAHMPCEIQVRTIMQHAYAELDHRVSYKPITAVNDPEMKRLLARSVALIEAADDHFDRVVKIVGPIVEVPKMNMANLATMYRDVVGLEPDDAGKSAYEILDALSAAADVSTDRIREFINANRYILDGIKERAGTQSLYRNPVILLVYWLAKTRSAATKSLWPLPEALLRPIYADLGVAL